MENLFVLYASELGARDQKKVGNNSWLVRRDASTIAYRLHNTDIVVAEESGLVRLDTGGWTTPTTKDRLNLALSAMRAPYSIGSLEKVWYLWGNGQRYPYRDDITIDTVTGVISNMGELTTEIAANKTLDRRIRKYLAQITPEFLQELWDGGTAGDCWHCGMIVVEGPARGQTLGDAFQDSSHLESHLEEGYIPLSLVLNAFRVAGFGDQAPALYLTRSDVYGVRAVKRVLANYLKARLRQGPAEFSGWQRAPRPAFA